MKFKTFAAFVGPSMLMMLVFIAAPLVTVFWQSFHLSQPAFERVEVQTCTPGFLKQNCVTEVKTRPVIDAAGHVQTTTVFVGLQSYDAVLELRRAAQAMAEGSWTKLMNIDFWKALRFTLTFTLITLPLVLGTGLALALAVNNVTRAIRGQIRWLFVGDGMMTALMTRLLGHPVLMFAQGWTIEVLMLFFRVWSVAPFAFVIFYAGLQTINMDTLESAIVDGASRWQRVRYVIIPHLMPLIVFVALIHLMDAYRVFDEVVGFSSQSHVISLQWLTYNFLTPDASGNRSIGRASASSMLTLIGIVILLVPLLRRTWRDHRGAR